MRNIRKIVPDNWTITITQNVRFLSGLCPENIQQNYILNGRLAGIFRPTLKGWSTVKIRGTWVPQYAIVPVGRPRPYSKIILNMRFIPKA